MNEINIVSLNQEKPNTCGGCKHSDNNLGFVSLRCAFIYEEMDNDEEHDGEWYDHKSGDYASYDIKPTMIVEKIRLPVKECK